jgi:hypothetical protein
MKTDMADMVPIAAMNEDLLHNILLRLPAKSFAFASCVNRFWSSVCNRILSRPKMISAFSRNPDQLRAGEEVLDKVLSEPIRPQFVIANITCGNMEETLTLVWFFFLFHLFVIISKESIFKFLTLIVMHMM